MEIGPSKRIDTRGRVQHRHKSTAAEISRRDEHIARLWIKGHTTAEIGAALDVVPSTVLARLDRMGIGPRNRRRYEGLGPVVEPCPWLDADMPSERVAPRWRTSSVIAMAQMLDDQFRESSFANVLANHVIEAADAGDWEWIEHARAIVGAAYEKLGRAHRIFAEADYRRACAETVEGDEILRSPSTPTLRAVP